LDSSVHTLSLTPAGLGHVVVDGFVVSDPESQSGYWVAWGVCAALALAGVGLWLAGVRAGRTGPSPGQNA
jgi:hypothetical protein